MIVHVIIWYIDKLRFIVYNIYGFFISTCKSSYLELVYLKSSGLFYRGDMMLEQKVLYFITVAEEKSFSAASKKLYLSQPNLSKQVMLLEREIGVTLFDRSGYRPVLTTAGEIYYKECKKIQKQVTELYNKLQQLESHEIEIGFTGLYQNRRIINAINEFKKENSKVKISLNKFNFDDTVNSLLNQKIHISFGIESNFKHYNQIKYHVLYNYDICVICSFDHPFAKYTELDVKQLINEEFIVLSKKYGFQFYQDFIKACKLDGFVPKIKKEVESFDSLVFDVSIGEGVAITSCDVVRSEEVKIIPLKNSHHSSKYVMAYLDKEQNPITQKLIHSILNYFELYNK